MRVLLDECVPEAFAEILVGHDVFAVSKLGWSGITNGELLDRAVEKQFDAFVTLDKGIPYQQPVAKLPLRFVVIRVGDNDIEVLQRFAPQVLVLLARLEPGAVGVVAP